MSKASRLTARRSCLSLQRWGSRGLYAYFEVVQSSQHISGVRSVACTQSRHHLMRDLALCVRGRNNSRGGTILYLIIMTPLNPASCDTRAIAAQLTFCSHFLLTLPESAYLKTRLQSKEGSTDAMLERDVDRYDDRLQVILLTILALHQVWRPRMLRL